MEAQDILYKEAMSLNMCKKFQDRWNNPNFAELCRMFFAGMDFCIEHDWPSVETMKTLFSAEDAASNGIFFESGEAIALSNVCALGDSEVNVYVPTNRTCDIYARHNSVVHIHAGKGAYVYVSVLDGAKIIVEDKMEGASIKASRFGGSIMQPELFNAIHEKTNKEG